MCTLVGIFLCWCEVGRAKALPVTRRQPLEFSKVVLFSLYDDEDVQEELGESVEETQYSVCR